MKKGLEEDLEEAKERYGKKREDNGRDLKIENAYLMAHGSESLSGTTVARQY